MPCSLEEKHQCLGRPAARTWGGGWVEIQFFLIADFFQSVVTISYKNEWNH